MKNIFSKIALVIAAAAISFGASANTYKYEKRNDESNRISRTLPTFNTPAQQLFAPVKGNTNVTMPYAGKPSIQKSSSFMAAPVKKVPVNRNSLSGDIKAAATNLTATDYSALYYEDTEDWYIVVHTASYSFIFDILTQEIELGKTYTYADMDPDYTYIMSSAGNYRVSAASFCMTESEGLERIECSMTSGAAVFNIVYQEIAIPTPTATVVVNVPDADFSDLVSSMGLIEFLGDSEDEKYFVNCTPYVSSVVGEHTIEKFYNSYTYVREYDNTGSYTQYAVLAFDGPVTVAQSGSGYTCHAKMIAENAILYDVTFAYVPHMSNDTNADLEVEFSPAEVTLNTSSFATDGSITARLVNDIYSASITFYVDKNGEAVLAPGNYAVNSTKQAGTILASPGLTGQSINPSFIGTLDGAYIDDIWFLVGGSATVTDDKGQLTIAIDAVNSYGKSVKISFKYGEKAGDGWGEWQDYAPKGDATGYYLFTQLAEGVKSDIPVQIRVDTGNPALAQIKLVGWASDVFVEGEGPDLVIDWNMETNKLRVSPQSTGIHNTLYDEDIIITDFGYALNESYLTAYPCSYDPGLGRFNVNVFYTTISSLGTGSGWGFGEEYFQMDGYMDYTFDGWLNAFKENVSAETAELSYECYEAGADVEYGMLYALATASQIITNKKVDAEKVAAILAAAEPSLEWGATFTLPAPGTYYVIAGSLDEDGEYSGNFDYEQYVFESSKNWKTIGIGEYTDDLITSFYDVESVTYDVEIQENLAKAGLYRVKNMFGAAYPYNDDPIYYREDTYVYIDATNPNSVKHYSALPSFIGLNWGDGELQWQAFEAGSLVDNVITFPTRGLGIFGPDGSGYYANLNGLFKLVIKYDIPLAYEVSGNEAIVVASENEYENEVVIPEVATIDGVEYAVTKIGVKAFAAQAAVTSFSIPASVNEIGASAFSLCTGIQTITCAATVPPTCGATAFYKINPAATIKVPADAVDAYKAADGWKMFANIEAIAAE